MNYHFLWVLIFTSSLYTSEKRVIDHRDLIPEEWYMKKEMALGNPESSLLTELYFSWLATSQTISLCSEDELALVGKIGSPLNSTLPGFLQVDGFAWEARYNKKFPGAPLLPICTDPTENIALLFKAQNPSFSSDTSYFDKWVFPEIQTKILAHSTLTDPQKKSTAKAFFYFYANFFYTQKLKNLKQACCTRWQKSQPETWQAIRQQYTMSPVGSAGLVLKPVIASDTDGLLWRKEHSAELRAICHQRDNVIRRMSTMPPKLSTPKQTGAPTLDPKQILPGPDKQPADEKFSDDELSLDYHFFDTPVSALPETNPYLEGQNPDVIPKATPVVDIHKPDIDVVPSSASSTSCTMLDPEYESETTAAPVFDPNHIISAPDKQPTDTEPSDKAVPVARPAVDDLPTFAATPAPRITLDPEDEEDGWEFVSPAKKR